MTRLVVPSNEVAHLWAHQSQQHARNATGSFYFRRDILYSYNTPIGRIVRNAQGDRAFFLTSRRYSNTTAKHVNAMHSAIPCWNAVVFHIPEVAPGGWNQSEAWTPADILAYYLDEIGRMEDKAKRARVYADEYLAQAQHLTDEAQAYCAFVGMAQPFSPELVAQLRAERQQQIEAAEQERARARLEEGRRLAEATTRHTRAW